MATDNPNKKKADQLKNLLRGNLSPVIRHFKEEMKNFSANLAFEKAEITRKKIEYLENYQARSVVANVKAGDLDVFSLVKEKDIAFVNYLMVRNGTMLNTSVNSLRHRPTSPPKRKRHNRPRRNKGKNN